MKTHRRGFTLIELSMVLIIIGLVIGGVLMGKELIKAAELRGLITQKDKFILTTNIFKDKYGALPGDMHPSKAEQFGFFEFEGTNAGTESAGNGNELIGSISNRWFTSSCGGECGAFWRHLSDAGLISRIRATLEADTDVIWPAYAGIPAEENWLNDKQSLYMPDAKFNGGHWGASSLEYSALEGILVDFPNETFDLKRNVFFLMKAGNGPTMSGLDAYALDAKIDDGKVNSGRFIVLIHADRYWTNGATDGDGNILDGYGQILTANSEICSIGGITDFDPVTAYNTNPATGGNSISCMPVFVW